jgi:TolB protein
MRIRRLGSSCIAVAWLAAVYGITAAAQQPAPPAAPARGAAWPPNPMPTYTRVKVYNLDTKATKTVLAIDGFYESPGFTADGKFVRFNGAGKLFHIPSAGGPTVQVGPPDFPFNHDRARSGDGKWEAVQQGPDRLVMTADWKVASKLPPNFYIHGMSLDGQWVTGACAGQICRVARTGGELQRLTSVPPSKDNAEFSHDGRWIYYDTRRDGKSEIWRVPFDGGGANDALTERVTDDEGQNWWPHLSPDGKWIAVLQYAPGVQGRASMVDATIRLLPVPSSKAVPGKSVEVARLKGGLGSFARNAWSPDSKNIAFTSYEPKD